MDHRFTRATFIAAFLLLSIVTFAQNPGATFSVISNSATVDKAKYETAIKAANMEDYRFRSKSNIIMFDDGTKVELYSAEVIAVNGTPINPVNYSDERPANYVDPVFHLTEEGTLVAMYPTASPK
ncbi:MAG TPA: hypothetical protein VL651_07530 [Bacteroidia bacterium]|jgi:hypothetical protein|nr:hypothetical protein [Bacteroidia bacterium]